MSLHPASQVIFCSEECKSEGMVLFHGAECSHLEAICPDTIDTNFLLAYRRLLCESWSFLGGQWPFNVHSELPIPENGPFLGCRVCDGKFTRDIRPNLATPSATDIRAEVQRIIFRRKKRNEMPQLWMDALTAIFLAKAMLAAEVLTTEDYEDRVARFIFAHALADSKMRQRLLSYGIRTADRFDVLAVGIGLGLCPGVADFFHSCVPNVAQCFIGGEIILRAIDHIKPGTPVKVTFGCLYMNAAASDRLQFMDRNFGYSCDCPACANTWPCYGEFPQRVTICPKCRTKTELVNILKADFTCQCGFSFCDDFRTIGKLRRKAEHMMHVMSSRYKLKVEKIWKLMEIIAEIIRRIDDFFAFPDKDALISRGYMARCVIVETIVRQLVFDLYNEAVRHCKEGSELLGSILAARSTIFFSTGNRKRCLEDIDRALKCQIPKKTKHQLIRRKYDVLRGARGSSVIVNVKDMLTFGSGKDENYDRMKKEVKSIGKYGYDLHGNPKPRDSNPVTHPDDIVIKVSGKENMMIYGASDALTVKYLPNRGRFYVATRQIRPGEIVMVEKPYATVLFAENWETHCQYCGDPVKNGMPCSDCATVIFCSEDCKAKAKVYHSVECNHMMNLAQFACTGGPYLAYRMITCHPLDYFLQRKDLISEMQNASVKVMPLEFIEPSEYINVYCLTDHANEKSPEDITESMITAVYLTKLLEGGGYFGPEPRLEDKVFITMLLLRNILIFDCSYFTYHERMLNDKNVLVEPPDRGMSIFAASSLANHSCAPNLSHYFIKGHMVFRAMGLIEEGEECTISYGDVFTTAPGGKRQEYLSGYFFECDCPACRNDWPNLESLQTTLRCPHCRTELPGDSVEDMKDYSCPKCKLGWKTFVEQYVHCKKEAYEASERINSGDVSHLRDDVWKIQEYLKAIYVVTVSPNKEYWTVANDLSYQHMVESLVAQRAAEEAGTSSQDSAKPRMSMGSHRGSMMPRGSRKGSSKRLTAVSSDASERSLPPPPGGNYGQYTH